MVVPSGKRARRFYCAGYSLAEVMMATAITAIISASMLLAFVSLKRNYAATTDFAINHADQMRLSDYMAQDFRRATKLDPPATNDVTLYLPVFYDLNNQVQTPTLDGKGGVYYGVQNSSIKVRYYLLDSVIYRQEGTATPTALAYDVKDFIFESSDLGKVVKTSITFKPIFRSMGVTDTSRTATAFYNTTLLRNNRGVY
ncbi:MAG: hypothetical protein ABI946_08800 [Chthoniobacterales bacterium]